MTIITDKELLRKKFPHLTEEELETWLFWKGNDGVISGNPRSPKPGTIIRDPIRSGIVWVVNDQGEKIAYSLRPLE